MEGVWGGQGSESVSHKERARGKDIRSVTAEADKGQIQGILDNVELWLYPQGSGEPWKALKKWRGMLQNENTPITVLRMDLVGQEEKKGAQGQISKLLGN